MYLNMYITIRVQVTAPLDYALKYSNTNLELMLCGNSAWNHRSRSRSFVSVKVMVFWYTTEHVFITNNLDGYILNKVLFLENGWDIFKWLFHTLKQSNDEYFVITINILLLYNILRITCIWPVALYTNHWNSSLIWMHHKISPYDTMNFFFKAYIPIVIRILVVSIAIRKTFGHILKHYKNLISLFILIFIFSSLKIYPIKYSFFSHSRIFCSNYLNV